MTDSEQHGPRDHSDRRRDGGDRGAWQSRPERGSGRDSGDRGFARRYDRRDGARPVSRGDGDFRGERRDGPDRSSDRRDERGRGSQGGGRAGDSRNDGRGGYRTDGSRRDVRRDERGGFRRDDRAPGRDDRGGQDSRNGWGERRREDRAGARGGYRGSDVRRDDRRDAGGGSGQGQWGGRDDRGTVHDNRRDDRRGGDRDRTGAPSNRDGGHRGRDSRGLGSDRGREQRDGFRAGPDRRDNRRGDRDGRSDRGWEDRRGGGRPQHRDDRSGRRDDRQQHGSGFGARDRDDRRVGHDDARPRFVAPEIDADVTGREIDRSMRHELKALEAGNAERVAQHLVMAARYLDDDPQFALEHANAAVRRAGRIGVVREAAGVAAYAAEDFALALKELRTHRRISGSQEHLPLMVDCQRALGRADKAMEEATSDAAASLDAAGKVALAMVVSGIHADAGDHDAALAALEIPQLDRNRGFSYSPDLFRAYAEALRAVGRDDESMSWERQAIVAEAALGMGQFSEPEIVDLGDDLDEEEARRTVRDAQRRHSAPSPDAPSATDAVLSEPGEGDTGAGSAADVGASTGTTNEEAAAAGPTAGAGAADTAHTAEDAKAPGTGRDGRDDHE